MEIHVLKSENGRKSNLTHVGVPLKILERIYTVSPEYLGIAASAANQRKSSVRTLPIEGAVSLKRWMSPLTSQSGYFIRS